MRNISQIYNNIKNEAFGQNNNLVFHDTYYPEKGESGQFYVNNNGYPTIDVNSKSQTAKRSRVFTLLHELGHYLSDVNGTRPVQLSIKREQTPEDISLKEVCILLEEEIRAWRLGFKNFGKRHLSFSDKILYSTRALDSVCTSLVVFLNKRVVCTAWYWVINKPTNWVFEKIDM